MLVEYLDRALRGVELRLSKRSGLKITDFSVKSMKVITETMQETTWAALLECRTTVSVSVNLSPISTY